MSNRGEYIPRGREDERRLESASGVLLRKAKYMNEILLT